MATYLLIFTAPVYSPLFRLLDQCREVLKSSFRPSLPPVDALEPFFWAACSLSGRPRVVPCRGMELRRLEEPPFLVRFLFCFPGAVLNYKLPVASSF